MKQYQMLAVLAAMDRISVAAVESPIAVFEDKGEIIAKFANTVMTQFWIRHSFPRLIGVYDKTFNPVSVKRDLSSAFKHSKEDALEVDD